MTTGCEGLRGGDLEELAEKGTAACSKQRKDTPRQNERDSQNKIKKKLLHVFHHPMGGRLQAQNCHSSPPATLARLQQVRQITQKGNQIG